MTTSRYLRCLLAASVTVFFVFVVNDCARASDVESAIVSVRPTKLWRFLGRNEEAILQRFRENIDEFSVGRIKCLRYCIESKTVTDETPHFLNLIWKLNKKYKLEKGSATISDKDFTPQILQGKSIKSDDSRNLQNKCTFSIVIGCETTQGLEDDFSKVEKNFIKSLQPNLDILEDSGDNGSSALNFVNEKLVDESNLTNETEISFRVQRDRAEISAVVFGNVTKIDLKIPIEVEGESSDDSSEAPRLTLATTRMPEQGAVALRLNVLDPPPGGWRLKIAGPRTERYRLIVTSTARTTQSKLTLAHVTDEEPASLEYFERDDERSPALETDNSQSIQEDADISSRQTRVLDENEQTHVSNDSETNNEFSARMVSGNQSPDEQNEQKSFKFPTPTSDVEIMDPNDNVTSTNHIEDRMIDRESLELDDLSRSVNDELPIKKHLIVDVNPNTNLIANPGTIHRVSFDITNNHVLTVRHYFVPRSSPFRIVAVRPPYGFVEITPGQTINVGVDIQIPPNIAESTVNTVTLQVQGIENLEKSANLYVRTTGSRSSDDVKPTIYYYFNNNCAGRTSAEKCLKSYWSVDITVQDSDSGLKSVSSVPRGVYPRSQYVSGTSSPVYFYYSNNCCNRVMEVTATDVAGNTYSSQIDVGVWYNLMEGEIAAIVLGVLLIILLIVLIIITVLYCMNRRESHDLPYSQRYGSRSTPASSS